VAKARVLVVDDSVVIRRLITRALESELDIEVVGTAANGVLALAKIEQLRPDLVTLDIEMPQMDGLTTLAQIRQIDTKLPVIMCSTLTERGASATLEALALGATDYVTKPGGQVSADLDHALANLHDDLVPKIRALCPQLTPAPVAARPSAPIATRVASGPAPMVQAVVIGVSTGGPSALADVIPHLPADLGVPVLVCQHMPPVFTRLLADRLDAKSALRVKEAADGDVITAGGVWIAPGGLHLVVSRHGNLVAARTNSAPPENSCRPAVDPLMRSAVEVWGRGVLAVVLTGMGQDGLRGCEDVVASGGRVIAQDEPSSVVWGMPGYVVKAGIADEVVSLSDVASSISRRVAGVGVFA
jgi:two-component system, chemotaxis family, protein-glutamate methylesterase/glutaminase